MLLTPISSSHHVVSIELLLALSKYFVCKDFQNSN